MSDTHKEPVELTPAQRFGRRFNFLNTAAIIFAIAGVIAVLINLR